MTGMVAWALFEPMHALSSQASSSPRQPSKIATVVSKPLSHRLNVALPVQSAVQQCHTSAVSLVAHVVMSDPVAPALEPLYGTPVLTGMQSAHSSCGGAGSQGK
jgi:hypothetical protein